MVLFSKILPSLINDCFLNNDIREDSIGVTFDQTISLKLYIPITGCHVSFVVVSLAAFRLLALTCYISPVP